MLYAHPDIRKQSVLEAEEKISAKRTRRMVLFYSAVEKEQAALQKLRGAELERFNKKKTRLDAAIAAIDVAINKAALALKQLHEIEGVVSNVESAIKEKGQYHV